MEFFPAWWFLLLPVALGLWAVTMNQEKQIKLAKVEQNRRRLEEKTYDEEHTTCLQCAEDVKLEAVVCRHCGTDISGSNLAEKQRRNLEFTQWAAKENARAQKLRGSGTFAFSVLGVLTVGVIVALFFVYGVEPFQLVFVVLLALIIFLMLWSATYGRARSVEAKIRAVDLWPV